MTLHQCVADFFRGQELAQRAGVVAVSGGPDSMALAHVCLKLRHEQRLGQLVLAHLNHQLRGAESDADEAFVASLPSTWNLPALAVQTRRFDIARLARETGDNLENAARETRYQWLTDVARQTGAAWVATGHSADDQAETVLHQLLRGSGLQGLAGMAPHRSLASGIDLIRPLLMVRRADILAYLREQNLAFRVDSSNDDLTFTRNRLRRDVLPMLERDFNPKLVEVLGRTAVQLREAQDYLTERAGQLLANAERPRAGNIIVLMRAPLETAAPLLVRELLRLVWQREGWPLGDMGFEEWERAAALARGANLGNDLPGGVQVRAAGQVSQFEMTK